MKKNGQILIGLALLIGLVFVLSLSFLTVSRGASAELLFEFLEGSTRIREATNTASEKAREIRDRLGQIHNRPPAGYTSGLNQIIADFSCGSPNWGPPIQTIIGGKQVAYRCRHVQTSPASPPKRDFLVSSPLFAGADVAGAIVHVLNTANPGAAPTPPPAVPTPTPTPRPTPRPPPPPPRPPPPPPPPACACCAVPRIVNVCFSCSWLCPGGYRPWIRRPNGSTVCICN